LNLKNKNIGENMGLTELKNKWIDRYRKFVCPICGETCSVVTTKEYKKFTCSCGYVETRYTNGTYSINTGD
jgi:transcription elongation factor Elf1